MANATRKTGSAVADRPAAGADYDFAAFNEATKGMPRAVMLAHIALTFAEARDAASTSARWDDVLNAARDFAPSVEEAAKNAANKNPGAIARAAASVARTFAFDLRIALASYSMSGHKANATQLAALGAILPSLQTKGALRDRGVNFGGIALPPLAGDIS